MRLMLRNLVKFLIHHPGRCRNYSSKREARMLRKMISKGERNSKKKSPIPTACSLHQYARYTLCAPESNRKIVLNKIFMDQIHELMTIGTYADEIYNCGIHVTQTRITPNYHLLYVYWIHTKDINEFEVSDLLKKVAAYIREELTSARIMAIVPEVRFVKDEDFTKIQYAESILDQIKIINDENIRDQDIIESENPSNSVESQFPPMKYDVFGLQYLNIMNNIENSMKRFDAKPVQATTESDSHRKEETKKFEKKELARTIFSNRYEMKKSRRAKFELFEDEFADINDHEECGDWPDEDEER